MARVFQKLRGGTVAGRKPWFIDWTDAGGRRHRVRTDSQTKSEAEAVLRARLSDNARCEILGTLDSGLIKPVLFQEFYEKQYLPYAQTRLRTSSDSRLEYLAKRILPYFGGLTLRSISARQIEEYMQKRSQAGSKPAPATINKERSLLSAVLNTACRRCLIDVNPVSRVRPLRENNIKDRWLTTEEVSAIIEKAEPWVRAFILFAVNTGLRVGEICSLRWNDIDSNPGFVRIGEESKGRKIRYVPLNSAAKAAIDTQSRHMVRNPESGRPIPVPFIFVNARFKDAYRPKSVYHSFVAAVRAVADDLLANGRDAEPLAGITFHTLRHTFASWVIQRGIPLAEVQQYLGHSSDVTTRRYAHLAPATSRRNALEVLVPAQVGTFPAPKIDSERKAL